MLNIQAKIGLANQVRITPELVEAAATIKEFSTQLNSLWSNAYSQPDFDKGYGPTFLKYLNGLDRPQLLKIQTAVTFLAGEDLSPFRQLASLLGALPSSDVPLENSVGMKVLSAWNQLAGEKIKRESEVSFREKFKKNFPDEDAKIVGAAFRTYLGLNQIFRGDREKAVVVSEAFAGLSSAQVEAADSVYKSLFGAVDFLKFFNDQRLGELIEVSRGGPERLSESSARMVGVLLTGFRYVSQSAQGATERKTYKIMHDSAKYGRAEEIAAAFDNARGFNSGFSELPKVFYANPQELIPPFMRKKN